MLINMLVDFHHLLFCKPIALPTKCSIELVQYILTSAQSSRSQEDHYNKSLMTILGLAGVLFCETEQTLTKWIIVCSEENTYLGAWGS